MIKVTMLMTLLAGMAMGTNSAINATHNVQFEKRDTKIIVESVRPLDTLSEVGIKNNQRLLLNSIRSNITSNFKVVSSFDTLNNAVAISVNSKYVSQIKALPGVKSVTENKLHMVQPLAVNHDETRSVAKDYGGKENVSAETMRKPKDTNDGEGTVIAILDNEFYLRGAVGQNAAWSHLTYTDLDESVNVRFASRPADYTKTHAYTDQSDSGLTVLTDEKDLGKEGSLYFNRKVPFYFDYGGDTTKNSEEYHQDFDVSSEIAYHGSHVASIAAGNDPDYSGIAPKAQLVCMKVFTNYKASEMDEKMGFSSSTGAYDIPILQALEDCIKLKVDGINMSLGSDLDDFDQDSITMKTLTKLANRGILTSISAGNAGKTSFAFAGAYGNWTRDMVETGILGSYANNAAVTTVASGQALKTYYKSAFITSSGLIAYEDQIVNSAISSYDEEHKMEEVQDAKGEADWYYVSGFGTSSDFSKAKKEMKDKYGIDIDGKIAVVNRGSISFQEKLDQAINASASGLVIINNDPTASDFNFHCSFGENTDPGLPVALVLYKDKLFFEGAKHGTFKFLTENIEDNPKVDTLSTFSTDGARFDLDLKPEITAPGDSIRGAVPPQTTEDKTDRPYSSYEFLSGTSMSAPNYAGAQSVMLSKEAKPLYEKYYKARQKAYDEAIAAGKTVEEAKAEMEKVVADRTALEAFRKTVDLRLASTAYQLRDYEPCPEGELEVKQVVSPRLQGAGMVNLGSAYNTKVYLEGVNGTAGTGKAKILLRNNSDINAGKIKLSFLMHNEDENPHTYNVSYSVMRPAVKMSNEFISSDYDYQGEVDDYKLLPGLKYYLETTVPDESEQGYHYEYVERTVEGKVGHNAAVKVTKDLEYYKTEEACRAHVKDGFIGVGRYYNAGDEVNVDWKPLPSSPYQSTQDYLIETVNCGSVTIEGVPEGQNEVTKVVNLDQHNLSAEVIAKISEYFEFGCYLEGFLHLEDQSAAKIDLSLPWLGFYGGEGKSYESAPVVEPFDFEKKAGQVYPSDLVNDITKQLVGKDNADFHSTMISCYLEPNTAFNEEKIFYNDDSLVNMTKTKSGYHLMGVDENGKYTTDSKDKLFAGSPHASNTIVLQQYVMRSVEDNYFTLTNKETNEVAYRSALVDMIQNMYGRASDMLRYPLYKSHVDASYIGSGIMAHRAFAVIPLYNTYTGEAFASGDYTLEFNYLLSGTGTWVHSSYTIHIDSDEPEVRGITTTEDEVNFHIYERNLTDITINGDQYVPEESGEAGNYVVTVSKTKVRQYLDANFNDYFNSGRLYIRMGDKAEGVTGALVRFAYTEDEFGDVDEYDYSSFVIVQHYSLLMSNDFQDLKTKIRFVSVTSTELVEVEIDDDINVVRSEPIKPTPSKQGCGGNIATTSITLSVISVVGIAFILVAAFRRKKLGGK